MGNNTTDEVAQGTLHSNDVENVLDGLCKDLGVDAVDYDEEHRKSEQQVIEPHSTNQYDFSGGLLGR